MRPFTIFAYFALFGLAFSSVVASDCSNNGGSCISTCDGSRGDQVMSFSCSGGGSPIFRKMAYEAYNANGGDGSASAVSSSQASADSGVDRPQATNSIICCRVNQAPTISFPDIDIGNYQNDSIDLTQYAQDSGDLIFQVISEDVGQVDCEVDSNILHLLPMPGFIGPANCTVQASDGFLTSQDTMELDVWSAIAFNGSPNQIINSSDTIISVNSVVQASCAYSLQNDSSFDLMIPFETTDGFFHTKILTGLPDGYTTIYARCEHDASFRDEQSLVWKFWIDLAAPTITSYNPQGGSLSGSRYTVINGTEYPFWAVAAEPDVERVKFDWWVCSDFANPQCLNSSTTITNTSFSDNKNFSMLFNTTQHWTNWDAYFLNITAYDYSNHSANVFLYNIDVDNIPPSPITYFKVDQGSNNGELFLSFKSGGDEGWWWCPNMSEGGTNPGCKVKNQYFKYKLEPFETEQQFWEASDVSTLAITRCKINDVITYPQSACLDPQNLNTSVNMTVSGLTEYQMYYFGSQNEDEAGNRITWAQLTGPYPNGWYNISFRNNTSPHHELQISDTQCIKYDYVGAPHDCNMSSVDISLFLYDNLNVSSRISNPGNTNFPFRYNVCYGLSPDCVTETYSDQIWYPNPNNPGFFNMTWNPQHASLNPSVWLKIDEAASFSKLLIYRNGSSVPIISLREIGSNLMFAYSSTYPKPAPDSTAPDTNIEIRFKSQVDKPGGVSQMVYEIPYKIHVNYSNFTVVSTTWFTACKPDNKTCYKTINANGGAPQTAIWTIGGLPQGVYNISIDMGNEGDNVHIERLINVSSSAALKTPIIDDSPQVLRGQ